MFLWQLALPCRAAGGEGVFHGEERELCSLKSAACTSAYCQKSCDQRLSIFQYPEYFLTQISAPTLLLFPSLMCHGAFIRALPYSRTTKVSSGSIYMNTSRMSMGELFLLQPNLGNCWLVHTHCVRAQKRSLVECSTFSSRTFWGRANLALTLGWVQ